MNRFLLLAPLILGLSSPAFAENRNQELRGFSFDSTLLIASEDYVPQSAEDYFERAVKKT